MNDQPFYHRVTLTFTARRELNESEVRARLEKTLPREVIKDTVRIEAFDEPEPGDPADLL